MNQNNVDFKLIIPLEKSEHEEEGGWYITGVAVGIGVDKEKDALTPKAIQMLADQINNDPIPLRNQHRVDDITEDIGLVYKATVMPNYDLSIEARLDEDNPDAQFLWKKLSKKKKYGLSIRGSSLGYYYDTETSGGRIRRHPGVYAKEISVTTRPVSDQTFGTVLQKAIDGDSLQFGSVGETMETTEIITDVATGVTESSTPENDTVQAATSPSDELVKSLMANDDFVTLIKTAVADAVSTPEQTSETETSVEDSTEVSKSETDATAPDYMELVKSAVAEVTADFSARLQALAERIPEVQLPGVLIKSETERDAEIIESIRSDPRQALRVGLAARHNELDRL
jgi:hypothetical protein